MNILYLSYTDIHSNVFNSQLSPLLNQLQMSENNIQIDFGVFLTPRMFLNKKLRELGHERLSSLKLRNIYHSYIAWGYPPKLHFQLLYQLDRWVQKSKPDIIHCRSSITSFLACKLREQKNHTYKIIIDTRGDASSEIVHFHPAEKANQIQAQYKALEQFAYDKADAHFSVAHSLTQMLKNYYGIFNGKSFTFPCWAKKWPVCQRSKEELRETYNLPLSPFIWVYSGSVSSWQSFDLTLEWFFQFEKNTPNQFLLVMTNEIDLAKSYLARFPIKNIKITYAKGDDLSNHLRSCDASLLLRRPHPISKAASPMKFSEFMQAGLPTLSSQEVGDCSDWILKNNLGEVVKSNSISDISTAAVKLIKEKESYKTKAFFEQNLPLEKFLPKYESAYKEIIS